MSMPAPLQYPFAVALGAMTSFELAASSLAGNARSCSFVLANTLSIPHTLVEFMDDRLTTRIDEPLWINDFAVNQTEPDYFCEDRGFRYALALIVYLSSIAVIYHKYRGNRTQELVIGAYAFVGALIGAVVGFSIKEIAMGIVPAAIWLALASMPLHVDENWKERRGYLRFD